MKLKVLLGVASMVTVLGAGSALAHHSFVAEFDAAKEIALTGTVTKVSWRNPHIYFFVDVKNDDGSVQNWAMELGSPNGLMRRGWKRDSLAVGDTVKFEGWRAKDGSFKGNTKAVILADGKMLFANSSAEADKKLEY